MRTPTSLVYKVDELAVDLGRELRKRVQAALLRPPIEGVGPVVNEHSHIAEVCAARPARVRQRLRPSRVSQPRMKVVQDLIRDMNGKWFRMPYRAHSCPPGWRFYNSDHCAVVRRYAHTASGAKMTIIPMDQAMASHPPEPTGMAKSKLRTVLMTSVIGWLSAKMRSQVGML